MPKKVIQSKKPKLLYRSETNRLIGGVAAGLAEYFDVDATLIRLAFVLITLAGGSSILIYIILWIIIPSESNISLRGDENIKKNTEEIRKKANELGENIKKGSNQSGTKNILALILIAIGIFYLLENFGLIFVDIDKFWPVALILLGFALLAR